MATRLALLTLALLLAGVARAGDAALEVLTKALASQRSVRAVLVQTRTDGDTDITVSVMISPRKGIVAKVTKPLLFAGMVSFDNGDVWRNYDPQADLLRIESSPSRFHLDVNFRKKLIAQNYVLTMEREALVAGRRTSVVFLKAKHPELADRRLYIDAANSLILRYVVDEPDGRSVVTVDTKSVDLESPVDVSEYEKLGDGAAKVEKAWGPIEVSRPSDAARYAGFTPVVPTEIPAGFAKQALHVVGTQKRPFVGVRLTDGMAVATVYLWKSVEGQEEPFKGACDAQGGNGTRVKVVGEVSDRLKGELARLFAREYGGQTSERGTVGSEGRVQDVRSTGGRAGVRRPKLVIDHEES
jgi:hypothetical protein